MAYKIPNKDTPKTRSHSLQQLCQSRTLPPGIAQIAYFTSRGQSLLKGEGDIHTREDGQRGDEKKRKPFGPLTKIDLEPSFRPFKKNHPRLRRTPVHASHSIRSMHTPNLKPHHPPFYCTVSYERSTNQSTSQRQASKQPSFHVRP